jgi:HTH-type transcriptional regulator / antitoxin HigA
LTIKPIRTEADLKQAKRRLSELFMANDAGVHDDEIEVLSTLIEQFERTKVRIDIPSPVAAIKFRMRESGLSPRQIEPFIGSRARVSEVLSGKRQLSIDMIRSLHEGLGIPYESLISKRFNRENHRQVSMPAINRLSDLGFELDPKEFPAFLSNLMHANSGPVLLRKTRTQRAASKTDQPALLLWQAAVLKKSESDRLTAAFDRTIFGSHALRVIARLSARSDGPLRAFRDLKRHGIFAAILPPLPGTFLDGAVMAGPYGNPVIGLTLRHDRVDSFWFTLLHELAHIALHYDQLSDREPAFIDDMDILSEDGYEREADQLAGESLIPNSVLSQVHWGETTTQDEIVAVAVRSRVHVAIAAGRWQRDHQNYKKFARLIERGTLRAMFELL